MAVGPQNLREVTEKHQMNVRATGVCVPWPRCVVRSKAGSLRSNLSVNGQNPPVRPQLQREHGIDDDPYRVFHHVKFPVEVCPDVAATSGYSVKPEGGIAKIADGGHFYFFFVFFFLRVAYKCW